MSAGAKGEGQPLLAAEQLRYVRLPTADLAAAADFAQRIVGLEPVGRTERLAYFRSDFRDHTLVYVAGSERPAIGLELRDMAALERAHGALAEAKRAPAWAEAEACAERRVKAMVSFTACGVDVELVVRPLQSGWRYFPSRDAGIVGLWSVALCSTDAAAEERLWTDLFGARVSDWVGDTAYVALDAAHHRLSIHPSTRDGLLALAFAVEGVDQLMQSHYFLTGSQVPVRHGPGRRPTSNEMFLTFQGPDEFLYSYVTEGAAIGPGHRPRQFPDVALSYCAWGSDTQVAEFAGHTLTRTP